MEMVAAVAWKPGEPLTADTLDLEEPRSDEVLVKIEAVGICPTEIRRTSGRATADCRWSYPWTERIGGEHAEHPAVLGDQGRDAFGHHPPDPLAPKRGHGVDGNPFQGTVDVPHRLQLDVATGVNQDIPQCLEFSRRDPGMRLPQSLRQATGRFSCNLELSNHRGLTELVREEGLAGRARLSHRLGDRFPNVAKIQSVVMARHR